MGTRIPNTAQTPTDSRPAGSKDWQGLGDLLELGADRLTTPVKDVHHAITDRWSKLAGSWQEPAAKTSRALTTPIYELIRLTGLGVGRAVKFAALTKTGADNLRPLWATRRGREFQALVNGLWGDELERLGSHLAIEMGLRDNAGEPVDASTTALSQTFPYPGVRLVVLLHGLGDTEQAWNRSELDDESPTRLVDSLIANSFTPVLVRYNTGLDLSDNGWTLSGLLEDVVKNWPVPIEEISLIGHSMGGLVARSALSAGSQAQHNWAGRTRSIITLGSPHLGAPLEKGVHMTAAGLSHLPESKPIGGFLNQRSAGIKALRFGTVDDTGLEGTVQCHFIAGAISNKPDNMIGRIVGDLIVPVASATGRGKARSVMATNVRVMDGRNHRALLDDPEVHLQIVNWLSVSATDLVD